MRNTLRRALTALALTAGALLPAAAAWPAGFTLRGSVKDEAGRPLRGATITAEPAVGEGPSYHAETDAAGAFSLTLGGGAWNLTASLAGYGDASRPLELSADASVEFVLPPLPRVSETVVVQAIRADALTPVTKSDIQRADLETRSHGQELPELLQQTPGLLAYSEAGNASGYSYFYLRGIQQTRVNITLDGVPLNDGEDSSVYFVDFADLQGALDSIQVQRGVGASSVGAAAYAGSINLASVDFSGARRVDASLGAGSFRSARAALGVFSGDLPGGFNLYARGVWRGTDGFRERSGVGQDAFYYGASRRGERSFFKLFGFSGRERTRLAFYAADEDTLRRDLRANPLRDEERDRFGERFTQAQYTRFVGASSSLALQGYHVGAGGWYRLWNDGAARDALLQHDLDWTSLGGTLSFNHARGPWRVQAGAHVNDFRSRRSRQVVGGPEDYRNRGFKTRADLFAKLAWDAGRWHAWGDAHLRRAAFRYQGDLDLGRVSWTFFNPKVGLRLALSPATSVYASLGRARREPTRGDLLAGEDHATVRHDLRAVEPESVTNLEAGLEWRRASVDVTANVYAMEFRDEIAATGELSAVGLPLRRNTPESYRRGLELEAAWRPTPRLTLRHAANLSRNRIAAWTQFYDVYDADGAYLDSVSRVHRDVAPLLSPAVTLYQALDWQARRALELGLQARYASRAQLDNTGARDFRTPDLFDLDARLAFDLGRAVRAGWPRLRVQVENLLDSRRQWPNGYSYLYFARDAAGADTLAGTRYFYPQAGRHVYATLDFTW
jgi:iron complex outermembrane receptor protein